MKSTTDIGSSTWRRQEWFNSYLLPFRVPENSRKSNEKGNFEEGELAQWLRAPVAPPGCRFESQHPHGQLTTINPKPVPGDPMPSFILYRHEHGAWTYMQAKHQHIYS